VLGPGVIARFTRTGDVIDAPRSAVLPCSNPQGLAAEDGTVWVSCSGPLGPTAEQSVAPLGPGALLRLDPTTLAVLERIDAAAFAPGTPALVAGGLVVGSLLSPRIASVRGGQLASTAIEGADLESIFECAPLDEAGLARALCTQFSRDRLLVVNADGPAPVVDDTLAVGAGGRIARGAQAVAVAPSEVAALGVGAAVLLGLSAEVALLPPEVLP
jgi:hypothetical protein